MQEIRLAKTAGFCFGVNRAVSMVYAMLEEGKTVYTLGPIIHNPQVVTDLEKRGVVIVDETGEVPQGAVLVVRTHGVPAAVTQAIKERGLDCCDATWRCGASAAIVRVNPMYLTVWGSWRICYGPILNFRMRQFQWLLKQLFT